MSEVTGEGGNNVPQEVVEHLDARNDDASGQAIGEVVLGNVDPRNLTREEFDASPDLLFHGSPRPFKFDRRFDYNDPAYQEQDYGTSLTLGLGFYATDTEDARDYAEVRAGYAALSGEVDPFVAKLLPYQARCLDLRLASDPSENAPLSLDFVNKWAAYFTASLDNEDRFAAAEPRFVHYFKGFESKYLAWLEGASDEEKTRDIQILLGTHKSPGPTWMVTFREFMLSEGYDGMIANQGSEKHDGKGVPSYVFYNLDKLGTYETWHEEEDNPNPDQLIANQ